MTEWEILALGLVLGVRHTLDADHLIALNTIFIEYRNPLRAFWVKFGTQHHALSRRPSADLPDLGNEGIFDLITYFCNVL
jgi:hypothetical protein